MQVSSLVKLIAKIKPGDGSDYFLLHTIISLVSIAVGSEDLPSKERVISYSFTIHVLQEDRRLALITLYTCN